MTGQIPEYGKNFRREPIPGWHPDLNHTAYVLKADPAGEWFIRAWKGSKRWGVFRGRDRDAATRFGKTQPNMRGAMRLLLDGIAGGFYELAAAPEPEPEHFAADGAPVTVGARFWDNDLTVVEITRVAVSSNDYRGEATQTWHQASDGYHSTRFDTLDGDLQWCGRLCRRVDGLDAEDYLAGTRFAAAKGSRTG